MKVNIVNLNPTLSAVIQRYLIGEGYQYPCGGPVVQYVNNEVASIETSGKVLYHGGHYFPDEILDAATQFGQIVELVSRPNPTKVKLNDKYTAIVTKDATQVGCQTFSNDTILSLADTIKELRK